LVAQFSELGSSASKIKHWLLRMDNQWHPSTELGEFGHQLIDS